MTARRAAAYPALARFAAGYLHQDFVLDHGTAKGARDAFLQDASARERGAFERDAARFLSDFESEPWADTRAAFVALGGAWHPPSRSALKGVLLPDAMPTRTKKTR